MKEKMEAVATVLLFGAIGTSFLENFEVVLRVGGLFVGLVLGVLAAWSKWETVKWKRRNLYRKHRGKITPKVLADGHQLADGHHQDLAEED